MFPNISRVYSCLEVSPSIFSYFQISGSQASSWLGLDNDSDEEDAQMIEDCHANLVREKPHFEGKAGEEVCIVMFLPPLKSYLERRLRRL